ncbi:ribosome biogenesis GTPase Der [Petrotoga sp. Shatin.DS.tank11.9.2.9.3]|uniref:ribosome biogenesis GTPase Der n=1 Tax=Petrotoga sp. Shatin.DS.tank11.9.2.9.3 TaxID=1469556 RepID=UPI000EF1B37B|nr:ribosome biogenesis GTPase Der [Petrotoga sp. Shatin.DS.tank11.9.2.9.3]RLL86149.1 GTP-binding protein Der [Petrotoga sp. Shatin.DS.tank11.9.2.9.3]
MEKPTVLIIGKPNVGKSTLFNRMIGERKSIVHDMPGVTRDNVSSSIQWDDISFTLVDTCGIFEQPEDNIEERQKKIIFESLKDVSLVVFVIDGKIGLTSEDYHIADYLRKTNSKVILVINKAENFEKYELEMKPEIYSLGFGEGIPVSAEHNKNIFTLMDTIANTLKTSGLSSEESVDSEKDSEEIKVSIVGRPNVGKSSLFNSIIGSEMAIVSEIPGTTRDAIDHLVTMGDNTFRFIDTAGMRKKSTIHYGSIEMFSISRTINAIEKSDVVILVVDSTEGITQQDKSIIGIAEKRGKGTIIAFNKWDLVSNNHQRKEEFFNYFEKELYFVNYSPLVFTSAPKRWGIQELITAIKEVEKSRNKKIPTSALNAALEKYTLVTPPPIKKGKRIKFYYATQVGTKPPVFVFYSNLPYDIPKYYQQGLRNMIRNYIDPFIGSPIFLKFEARKNEETSKTKQKTL